MKLFIHILIFLTPLVALAQQGQDYYVEKAKEKYDEGDHKYALTLINQAIELNDTAQWPHVIRSEIVLQLYGIRSALNEIKLAIKLNPLKAEPYNRCGAFYNSIGVADSSIAMYDKAILLATNDTIKYSYILNRGTTKASIRDFEGAREDYEQALKFDPNDIGALNNIAPVYRQLGRIDDAIYALKKVMVLDSLMTGPYINLGFLYSFTDSLDLALENFDKAIKIEPDEPLAYNNRGYVHYKKGDFQQALLDINKSLSMYPTNAYAYRNLALVYIEQKNMDEACVALSYASRYRFTSMYGGEVDELIKIHCATK